jgi:hypothetical protein
MTWGAIAGAAVSAGVGVYSANKQASAAKKAAAAGTPVGYSAYGPGGNVTVDPNSRQVNMSLPANPFTPMFQGIGASSLANAATAPGSYLYGADPELASAYQGLTGQGIVDAAQGRYDVLNQLARPQEQRAFNSLEDRLFARGQMGSTGGSQQYEAFQNASNQADLQRQLSAQDWAQTNALNRFNGALAAVGSGQAGQANNWNIGTGAFSNLQAMFNPMFQQAQIGLGAATGTPPSLALNQANTAGGWVAPVDNFMQNIGGYNAIGSGLAGLFNKGGGSTPYQPTTTPTGAPVTGGSATNPYGLDFSFKGMF